MACHAKEPKEPAGKDLTKLGSEITLPWLSMPSREKPTFIAAFRMTNSVSQLVEASSKGMIFALKDRGNTWR